MEFTQATISDLEKALHKAQNATESITLFEKKYEPRQACGLIIKRIEQLRAKQNKIKKKATIDELIESAETIEDIKTILKLIT